MLVPLARWTVPAKAYVHNADAMLRIMPRVIPDKLDIVHSVSCFQMTEAKMGTVDGLPIHFQGEVTFRTSPDMVFIFGKFSLSRASSG